MIKIESRNKLRLKRRLRSKIHGTAERPRLCVFISNKNIYVQIIDDDLGKTIVAASTVDKNIDTGLKNRKDIEAAGIIGEIIAQRAIKFGIKEIVFDRSGYKYHGRVKMLAERARKAGLIF